MIMFRWLNPNPPSSHKYEVKVSIDDDDHEDGDDDYDKATTVAQTAPEPRWAKMSWEVEVIVVAASWCFVEEIILCWDGKLK